MATNTLNSEFDTLGSPWQTAYPWAPDGFTGGDQASWLANPASMPADANPISVDNGVLTISNFARPSDVPASAAGGMPRIGGMINTQDTFSQKYGYFEARIQMPSTPGTAGAFWLMPATGADSPQLDVIEMIGQNPTVAVNTVWGPDANSHWTDVANMSQGFHTFAVDWEPDKITWYVDGKETYQTATPADLNEPMYLTASLTSGQPGSWEGEADPSATAQMKIDYIRAYTANPNDGGTLTFADNGTGTTSGSTSGTNQANADSNAAGGSTGPNGTNTSSPDSAASNTSSGNSTGSNTAPINASTLAGGSPDAIAFTGSGNNTGNNSGNTSSNSNGANGSPGQSDVQMTPQDLASPAVQPDTQNSQFASAPDNNSTTPAGALPDQTGSSSTIAGAGSHHWHNHLNG